MILSSIRVIIEKSKRKDKMATLNTVTILGRLVKDPEIRTTSTGKTVSQFTIAFDKRGKDANANFIDATAWESRADFLSKYGHKGAQILVHGRLDQQTWEKDGKVNSKIGIIADEVQLLSTAKSQDIESKKLVEEAGDTISLDEIPF